MTIGVMLWMEALNSDHVPFLLVQTQITNFCVHFFNFSDRGKKGGHDQTRRAGETSQRTRSSF